MYAAFIRLVAFPESKKGASATRAKTYAESTLSRIVVLIEILTVLPESFRDAAISESALAFV